MILGLRRDADLLARQDRGDPFRRPAAFGGIVDSGQRLQGDRLGRVFRERAAEIVPVAAHRERRGADRAAEVEGENLGAGVAAELQRHQREQHRFAGACRPDDERMADIADMEAEAERRRAFGPREEERRPLEMVVARRAGPDRRERDHVGEVQRRDRRLTDIGVSVPGQRAEPGFDRVDRLDHAGEVAALDDLLDQPQFLVGEARIVVPDGDGRGDVGLADDVGAQLLERGVGVHRLVVGVGVEKRRGLVGHHLLEDRGDRFALGEPLPPDLGQQLRRIGLVEHDRAASTSGRGRRAG